jgi:hypothetical protein
MEIYREKLLRIIKNYIFPPVLQQEALDAYYYKLPNNIQVEWIRDGKYIIGKVIADNHKFTTQGRSVEDFVEMVNDAVYTVNGIPLEYIDTIRKYQAYNPSVEVLNQLKDLGIKENKVSFIKGDQKKLQLA